MVLRGAGSPNAALPSLENSILRLIFRNLAGNLTGENVEEEIANETTSTTYLLETEEARRASHEGRTHDPHVLLQYSTCSADHNMQQQCPLLGKSWEGRCNGSCQEQRDISARLPDCL